MKDFPLSREMKILVLGKGDEVHKNDFEEIRKRFEGTRFAVEFHEVMDRAGYCEFGSRPAGDQLA